MAALLDIPVAVKPHGDLPNHHRTETGALERLFTIGDGIEEELWLRLLGRHRTSSDRWQSLSREADWDRLVALAGPQMAPLLAHRLCAAGLGPLVPPQVGERLGGACRVGAMAQLQQRAALRTAVSALARAGIAAVAIKGVALVESVYNDATHRLMSDIDLWVPSERLQDGVDALGLVGFEIPARHKRISNAAGPAGDRPHRELVWRDAPVLLELHAPPTSLARLSDARRRLAWERATPSATFGPSLRILGAEDLLLHVGLHAARHDFEVGVRPLVDLLLIVERWGASWRWEQLASDYRAEHVEVPMYVSLALARDLLGAPIPDSFFNVLPQPPEVEEICRLSSRRVLGSAVPQPLPQFVRGFTRQPSFATRLGMVARRLTVYYWPRDRPQGQPFRDAVADVLRRLRFDLQVKVPKYWRSWRQGLLSGKELRRRADRAREGGHIHRLMIDAERRAGEHTGERGGTGR